MHPELITLPGGLSIKTYGFCLMVGFLTAVWFAMRRATRVKASADRVLDIAFICLAGGVGGARIFYVIHYWNPQFATAKNKFLAVVDITSGGLEFLGGFLGAVLGVMLYCYVWCPLVLKTKISLRLYLDIMAPSCLWGLAFGRIGCFFNGCCFGGLCAVGATTAGGHALRANHPWAVRFPYGSPAFLRHWEDRQVTVPAELLVTAPDVRQPIPIPAAELTMPIEKRERPIRAYQDATKAYKLALAKDPDGKETKKLARVAERAKAALKALQPKIAFSQAAMRFPSRLVPTRRTSLTELQDLAASTRSVAVHPTQLYSSIQAMLLSGVLSTVFYRRKRHGVVIGLLLLLYPIQRTILELIRADNPHDIAGLTISQSVGVALFVSAIVYFVILYKFLPERSPYATVEVTVEKSR